MKRTIILTALMGLFTLSSSLAQQVDIFESQINSAFSDFSNDHQAMALLKVTDILKLNPNRVDAHYLRGRIYGKLGESEKALDDYDFVIERLPDYSDDIYVDRGSAYLDLENFSYAIKDFSRAIEINNEHLLAYILRAYSYHELGNFECGIQYLNKALSADPSNIQALFIRGHIKWFGLEDYQSAIDDFTSLLKIDPQHFDAYYERGIAYLNLGMNDKACQDLKASLALGVEEANEYILEYCD